MLTQPFTTRKDFPDIIRGSKAMLLAYFTGATANLVLVSISETVVLSALLPHAKNQLEISSILKRLWQPGEERRRRRIAKVQRLDSYMVSSYDLLFLLQRCKSS